MRSGCGEGVEYAVLGFCDSKSGWMLEFILHSKNRSMNPFSKRVYSAVKRTAEAMLIRHMAHITIEACTYQRDRFARHFGPCRVDPIRLG
jgi:hypothetical protein